MNVTVEIKDEDFERWLFGHNGAYSTEWLLELDKNEQHAAKVVYLDQNDKKMTKRVGRFAWQKGVGVMATKFPRRFAQMMEGDDDNETFDLVWQCIIFGDEVYA